MKGFALDEFDFILGEKFRVPRTKVEFI